TRANKAMVVEANALEAAAAQRAPLPGAAPRPRATLLDLADRHGTVRMSPAEAPSLGLEQDIAQNVSDLHLRNGGSTEFKLGAAENVAMRESGEYQPKPGCYVDANGVDAPSLLVKSVNPTDMAIKPSLAGRERVVSFVDAPEPPPG